MNLQQLHVKIIKQFGKATSDGSINNFIKLTATDLLKDKEFLQFFKKKISLFIKYKGDKKIKEIGKQILSIKSYADITKIFYKTEPELSKKFFNILIHSYLQWRNKFNLMECTPSSYYKAKKEIVTKFKEKLLNKNYKVAFFIWGSFLMRKINFNTFSDIDLVIVVDDKKIINKLNSFLLNLFQDIGIEHYNLPAKKEVSWFTRHKGVARCGVIHNGIFLNFKILTTQALINSTERLFKMSLKESNQGFFLIPDFKGYTLQFSKTNSIPVYPFCFDGKSYNMCRGFIPEFLHTGELVICKDSKLQKKLRNIQKKCIRRSIALIKAYNTNFNKRQILNKLIDVSYTPRSEIKKDRLDYLLKLYSNIYEEVDGVTYLSGFFERIYGELVLPLLKTMPKKYWLHNNLLLFFLGTTTKKMNHINSEKIKEISKYFERIKYLHKKLNPNYISFVTDEFARICKSQQKLKEFFSQISPKRKDQVLLTTAFFDIIEKFCTNHSRFYFIKEIMFREFFPREYKKSSKILKKILSILGGKAGLQKIKRKMEKELKESSCITGTKLRIRREAGLYQHHLMKNIPLDKIDDIISIEVMYTNKNRTVEVVKTVEDCLKKTFKTKIIKKILKIMRYRGYHFYFQFNSIPFEIMIRDLTSDLSIKHKIEHSIKQKRQQRLN